MLHLNLSADITGASHFLSQLREQRAAKAIARALNSVALESRDAVRQEMPHRFTLRRPWVLRGIGVEFARSSHLLQAAVFSRDAFMRDQEEGGKRSGARSQIIAVGRMAAIKKQRVLTKSQQPQALMAKKNVFYHEGTLFERRGGKHIEALLRMGELTLPAPTLPGPTIRVPAWKPGGNLPQVSSGAGGSTPDYHKARAVKEFYAARLAKLEFEEREGKLVNIDEINVQHFNRARRLRDRMLMIPRRISAQLAAQSDARTVDEMLEAAISDALEDISGIRRDEE